MHDLLVKSKALQHGPEMLILLRFTSLWVFWNACILADSVCVCLKEDGLLSKVCNHQHYRKRGRRFLFSCQWIYIFFMLLVLVAFFPLVVCFEAVFPSRKLEKT